MVRKVLRVKSAPAGADGVDGAQGPQGKIGLTGAQGPQGKIGPAGADGLDGTQGPQGKIGPPRRSGSARKKSDLPVTRDHKVKSAPLVRMALTAYRLIGRENYRLHRDRRC